MLGIEATGRELAKQNINFVDNMSHNKYERQILIETLSDLADDIREQWPMVASILYGAKIAVKMNATYDAAQVMARFSKTLIDPQRKKWIEQDLQKIQVLILQEPQQSENSPD